MPLIGTGPSLSKVKLHCLRRALDHAAKVLESFVGKPRHKKAALKCLKKAMCKCGRPEVVPMVRLRYLGAALNDLGAVDRQAAGRWFNNTAENSHLPSRNHLRASAFRPTSITFSAFRADQG